MNKKPGTFFPLIFLAVSFIVAGCDHDETVVAEIGDRAITSEDFSNRYSAARKKLGLPDNGQVREQILQEMIDEELLIDSAQKKGFLDDQAAKFETNRIRIQNMLDLYQKHHIWNRLNVPEEELKEYFIRFNTRLKARHLYAPSRREADSLHALLMAGHSFEKLAATVFKDERLQKSGGSLGSFTVDEMDANFENAAFALQVGEISRPVHTAQGYSIIQLLARTTRPLLTGEEFVKQRAGIAQYAAQRKRKELSRAFADSLRQFLQISFEGAAVRDLLKIIRNREPQRSENAPLAGTELLEKREIMHSRDVTWNVRTLKERARYTSEEQLQWVANEENLQDWIAGLVIRDHMLAEAHRLGLDKSDEFLAQTKLKSEDYLLKRMGDYFAAATIVPEDSLHALYASDPEKWSIPARIHLAEIALGDERQAELIRQKLMIKTPFAELAAAFSVRTWSAEKQGDIGDFTAQELGPYASQLLPLHTGQWTGPVKMDTFFVFFKCIDKYPSQQRSFAEARRELEKTLRPFEERRTKQEALRLYRSKSPIRIFKDTLLNLHI